MRLFAGNNFRVATCGRDADRLSQLKRDINEAEVHMIESVDLSDIEQTKEFGQQIIERYGQVDVLVNNAAVAPLDTFEDITPATFEQLLDVNVRSTFYLTQMCWPHMKQQGRGVVVNISSLAAVDPFPGFSIYGASKAWIDLMTVALSAEGQEHNVRGLFNSRRCGGNADAARSVPRFPHGPVCKPGPSRPNGLGLRSIA